jgi:DNA-3-methyladenine glycosylase II
MAGPVARLDRAGLRAAARALGTIDPTLGAILGAHGPPPLWARRPGFPTLVRIVLEQQVSLGSADAAWRRLVVACDGRVRPASVLRLSGDELRRIGFSRQKASYVRGLAESLAARRLDLAGLAAHDDEAVRDRLLDVRGLGPWSADIYLIMALGRPDVWPAGDLALRVAQAEALGLTSPPDPVASTAIAEAWRPWRSVAARMLWQAYLLRRGRPLG